jgi:hypothetical protein
LGSRTHYEQVLYPQAHAEESGYKAVQTQTKNMWRSMLILNIKNGFDIIGTYTDNEGETKIIIEKMLTE